MSERNIAKSAPIVAVNATPAGWKLVPIVPTKRMTCEAFIRATLIAPDGWSLGTRESQELFDRLYRAMLDAAPEAPSHCGGQEKPHG